MFGRRLVALGLLVATAGTTPAQVPSGYQPGPAVILPPVPPTKVASIGVATGTQTVQTPAGGTVPSAFPRAASIGLAPATKSIGTQPSTPAPSGTTPTPTTASGPAATPGTLPTTGQPGGLPNPDWVKQWCQPDCQSCNTCEACYGGPGRFWVNAQWLYWATSGQSVPALATASPVGTARPLAGTLGTPNTATLFGNQRTNDDFRNGYRLTGGMWLDDGRKFGIAGDFFFLGQSTGGFSAASNGAQIIARPFTNALTGQQDSELVSYPGVLGGAVSVSTRNNIIGGGVNGLANLCCDACGRVDLLLGYRYFGVRDEVSVREDLTALGGAGPVPAGTRYQISDSFKTQNNFNGGVIGIAGERQFGRMFIGGQTSIAFGANTQVIDIAGSTLITPPAGPPVAYSGGLLAQPSNIGHYTRTVFAVLPEVGVRAGVRVTDSIRVFAGYNFLYLSNVARAGDQIDPRVNPNFIPPRGAISGPAYPAFSPKTTDMWVQGVSLGVEFRF